MTVGSGTTGAPHPFTDEARALGIDVDDPGVRVWMEAHLPDWRQQASGQRPLYWILGIGFVVGLAVVVFVQIWPEAKRRQLKRSIDAYDAALRERAPAGSDQMSGDDRAPTAR